MSTGNDKSHNFGRNAAIASAIALSLFSTAAAPAAYAQEPARATPVVATMPGHAGQMEAENIKAAGRALRASDSTNRIGVYVETGPSQEKSIGAAEWGSLIEEGLNKRGNAVNAEVRSGTSLYEPGIIGIFVNGDIAWKGSIKEFNASAKQIADRVDAKQEHQRQIAGLPIDTFPLQRADLSR